MKYIFLDFDRTLFDTERFYNFLERIYIEGVRTSDHVTDLSQFLYSDVASFIWNIRQAGFHCHLVTYGPRSVQECKFKLSGLEMSFDQIFYVEQGSKASVIKQYLQSAVSCETVVFVDDMPIHLEQFAALIPDGLAVRMARPGARGSDGLDERFVSFSGLDAVYDYITSEYMMNVK